MPGMNINRIWLILAIVFIGIACIPCGYAVSASFWGAPGTGVVAGAGAGAGVPAYGSVETSVTGSTTFGTQGLVPEGVDLVAYGSGSGFQCSGPNIAAGNMNHPSSVNAEGEFTFTITVTNSGTESTKETDIEIILPGNVIITPSTTVPPLEPGESIEITITITIPPGTSIGNGFFQVNLDPDRKNPDCSRLNNNISDTILILPDGLTMEEYDMLTNQNNIIKITELLYRMSHQGGGEKSLFT